MSEKKKRGFQKGVSGNPGGRPKLTEKDKIVSTLTRETWNEMSQAMMTLTREQISDLVAGGVPYEVELFLRHMLDLGENPDWHAYEKYMARRIGKVPDHVQHSGPEGGPIQFKDHEAAAKLAAILNAARARKDGESA